MQKGLQKVGAPEQCAMQQHGAPAPCPARGVPGAGLAADVMLGESSLANAVERNQS